MPHFECPSRNIRLFYEIIPPKNNNNNSNNNNNNDPHPEYIVFIMGLLADGSAWEKQTSYFSSLGYTCLRFDNRGIGHSSAPKVFPYTTKLMAEDTLELINHLGLKQFHIIGISMGGMISQQLALLLHHSNRILSLTLTATHCGGFNARVPLKGLFNFWKDLFETNPEKKIRGLMKVLYHSETLADPVLNKELYDLHTARWAKRVTPTLAGVFGQIGAVATHHVNYNNLLKLRFDNYPILIVVGTQDILVREFNSVILSRVLGAELLVLNKIGHGIVSEATKDYNEQVAKHLEASVRYRKHFSSSAVTEYKDELKHLDSKIFDPSDQTNEKSKNPRIAKLSGEYSALCLCCQHSSACFTHIAGGAMKGALLGIGIHLLHMLVQRAQHSESNNNLPFGFRNLALLCGSIFGLFRASSCIVNGFRARLAMQKLFSGEKYQSKVAHYEKYRNNNPLPASTAKYTYTPSNRFSFPIGYGLEWPVLPSMFAIIYLAVALKIIKQSHS